MERVEEPQRLVGPRLWEIRAVRDLMLLAALGLSIGLALALRGVLLPVVIALILAYLFDPLLDDAERRWHWPRVVTAVVLVLGFLLLLAACLVWLWPIVTEQIAALGSQMPAYLELIAAQSGLDLSAVGREVGDLIGRIDEPREVVQELLTRLGQALGVVRRVVGVTTYVTVTLILIPIYFFFSSGNSTRRTAGCVSSYRSPGASGCSPCCARWTAQRRACKASNRLSQPPATMIERCLSTTRCRRDRLCRRVKLV